MAAALLFCAVAPAAGAADWLPTFDLGTTGVSEVKMTPEGDIAIRLNTDTGPALRFRPAGGPLGPLTTPFPAGADSPSIDMDAQGNTFLVWTRAGTLEARVQRRDGSLTAIQTVQTGVLAGNVAASPAGEAAFSWIGSDANRTGSARTRDADGTLGPVQTVTVAAEKTRNLEADVDADGDATFVWTTPDAPPNTKVKARTLGFSSQTLSGVLDVSTPPSPELSDESRVVVDPAGNATIVWRHLTATQALTETRKLSAAGALGGTQVLTSLGFRSQAHDVAVDDAGNARIVWAERNSGPTDPFLPVTCITGALSSCGAFASLSTSQSLSTTVAMGPAGDAMVGWADPAGTVRFLPRVGGAGGTGPTHVLSATAELPVLALDGNGNGVAVWREGTVSKGAGFDAVPPSIQSISIPQVIERGVKVDASVAVLDVWGATSQWKFGDGGTAQGLSVNHTFKRTGSYRVEVTATDGTGASGSAARQVTVRDTRQPPLGRVTMKRTRFRVSPAPTAVSARELRRRPKRGSAFRFSLGENATIRIAIKRRVTGRKVGRLRRDLTAGRRRVSFTGRIGPRALKPGRYRALLRAVDPSGNRSVRRQAAFSIVR